MPFAIESRLSMNAYADLSVQEKTVPPAAGFAFPAMARTISLPWKKLRPDDLAAMAGACTPLVGPRGLIGRDVIAVFFRDAPIANILHFARPLVGAYVAWRVDRPRWLRCCLFAGVTVLSTLFAIAKLLAAVFARFD